MPLAKRIIPCLTCGAVVKNVSFVQLRDAGPVETRAATTPRAPTRSPSSTSPPRATRATRSGGDRTRRRPGLHPSHRGWRRAPRRGREELLNAGADKVSINTAAVESLIVSTAASAWLAGHRRRDRRASVPEAMGVYHGGRKARARCRRMGAHDGATRRQEITHEHGSRRHAQRFDLSSRARSARRCRAGHRQRRRGIARAPRARHRAGRADAVLPPRIPLRQITIAQAKRLAARESRCDCND